ncbi:MAG: AraC family transcriptional regulator [Pseudomonadota bacterium]
MDDLRRSLPARQRLANGDDAPRHRHDHAYAALVLAGDYVEAGDAGRRHVSPGDVILHDRFEAHANRFGGRGATVLNLPLPQGWTPAAAFMRLADPDAVVRAAERCAREAVTLMLAGLHGAPVQAADWPDLLAEALRSDDAPSLGDWARKNGLAAATVSRGFRQAFGVAPVRYRAEVRGLAAWRGLADDLSLADLAAQTGFADQAHMTRAIVALTGRPPGAWRRSNRFKTAEPRAS